MGKIMLYNIAPEETQALEKHYQRYLSELMPYEVCEISEDESWNNQLDERIHRFWIFQTNTLEIVGFVFMAWQDGYWDIVQFTVFEDFRNNRFGREAVNEIKRMFNGEIRLSVLAKNPALEFWKKQGIALSHIYPEEGVIEYCLIRDKS